VTPVASSRSLLVLLLGSVGFIATVILTAGGVLSLWWMVPASALLGLTLWAALRINREIRALPLGHTYTQQRGFHWLVCIFCLGALMFAALFALIAGLVPIGVFLAVYLLWGVGCVAAVLDFILPTMEEAKRFHDEQDLGEPVQQLEEGQVWQDCTAPEELIRVVQVRPGGTVLIERIAGVLPVTHHKVFPVSARELRGRFELILRDGDSPEKVEAEQVWVDRGGIGERLKILHVDETPIHEMGNDEPVVVVRRITAERTAGYPNDALHRPFTLEEPQLRAAFKLDPARTKTGRS
jgi:hypothetical protein